MKDYPDVSTVISSGTLFDNRIAGNSRTMRMQLRRISRNSTPH